MSTELLIAMNRLFVDRMLWLAWFSEGRTSVLCLVIMRE